MTIENGTKDATPAGAASVLTEMLGSVALPPTRNVWKPASTRRRAIARRVAPKPKALVYYPDLPNIGQHIWALWKNGLYGLATYVGGWTYKADCGKYINEMPVCWHSMPN